MIRWKSHQAGKLVGFVVTSPSKRFWITVNERLDLTASIIIFCVTLLVHPALYNTFMSISRGDLDGLCTTSTTTLCEETRHRNEFKNNIIELKAFMSNERIFADKKIMKCSIITLYRLYITRFIFGNAECLEISSLSPITIVVAKSRQVAFFVFSGCVKASFLKGFTIGRYPSASVAFIISARAWHYLGIYNRDHWIWNSAIQPRNDISNQFVILLITSFIS